MKKLFFTFIAVMCCMVMNAQNRTFTAADGITYNITGENTVEVGENNNFSGSVVIPTTVINPDDSQTYNVTGIGKTAFFWSSDITSVTIPEGVTYIGHDAFSLTNLTSVSLPEGLISIGDDAFYKCENLEGDLVIPSTVTSIGHTAFKCCFDLTSVTIKGGSIGDEAFSSCSGLTSISLQEGVTGIGSQAFSGCNLNGDLVIPSTVKSTGYKAFESCSSLTSVTIKGGSIGDETFYSCSRLTSISLQEGVTSIGANVFKDCGYVLLDGDLIIPSTVKSIGDSAFVNVPCDAIKVFALVPPVLGQNVFFDIYKDLYVPDVEKYQKCEGWKDFGNIKLLTEFKLGDQIYLLNETGDYLDQNLTFNDKYPYVSGLDFTAKGLTYSRTFKDTNWQPLYVPFAMSYNDWKDKFEVAAISSFQESAGEDDNAVEAELGLRIVKSGTLTPNTPYLIRAFVANETDPQTIEISSKKIYKSEANSISCSSIDRQYTFSGSYQPISELKTKGYVFMSDGKLMKPDNDEEELSPQRWYLTVASRGTSSADEMQFDIKPIGKNIPSTMLTEQPGPALKVTDQDDNEYILYAPKKIKMIKIPATTNK